MDSPVSEFYSDKNVFITGVTGFLAKSVVEKLLRRTNVNKIYVLIREKKGKSINERMDDIKRNPVFDRLKQEKGDSILYKVVPIAGDMGMTNLNLSEADRTLLMENVDVVIHSAATLDFELNAKLVININLMGTKRVLSLCSQMQRLRAFVYVSTAYVNSDKSFALEKLYPKPGKVDDFISILKLSDEDADKTLQKLINGHINSYTVSKALAEHEVSYCSTTFPTAIVRPSMIVGAWQEPSPGWTDSKNGPNGFFMGAELGIVRRLPVNKDLVYDYIPVDIVTNELIVAAWKVGTERSSETRIFHCTSSIAKPFSWKTLEPKINHMLVNYPLKSAVWYPTLKLHSNFTLFRISTLFLHFLPGILFDILLKLQGRRPMLVKMHYKVDSSLCRLAPFIFKEWFFDSSNTEKLHESLTETDRIDYNLDIRQINYEKFFEDAVRGVRRYLNKEPDETLTAARRKVKVFYVLNHLAQFLFLFLIWLTFATITRLTLTSSAWIVLPAYVLFSFL
ncbi:hypothetical protein RUM43_001221 [Polyplax serrata]|uniref:Fatty acyl-CoA reductase n=1 Tax=Polyplax serrata TaxID=468196 RepID=A0AAN8SIE9_POLSC